MGQERLSGPALLRTFEDITVSPEEVSTRLHEIGPSQGSIGAA